MQRDPSCSGAVCNWNDCAQPAEKEWKRTKHRVECFCRRDWYKALALRTIAYLIVAGLSVTAWFSMRYLVEVIL